MKAIYPHMGKVPLITLYKSSKIKEEILVHLLFKGLPRTHYVEISHPNSGAKVYFILKGLRAYIGKGKTGI